MKTRVKSLAASFHAAASGIAYTVRHERNMRIHTCIAAYVIFFGILGKVSAACWALFFLCFAAVMSAELVNTALERLCDVVEPEFNRAIGVIKDVASGAVLVSAACAAVAGLCVFLSPDVFWCIMNNLAERVWLWAVIALSLPIALLFVFKNTDI